MLTARCRRENEFLAVSASTPRKFGVPVVPHAVGDMGQLHQHHVLFKSRAFDKIVVPGTYRTCASILSILAGFPTQRCKRHRRRRRL